MWLRLFQADAQGVTVKRLQAGDVRLSMGGEPTFVSIDDRDAPEWNTEALGEAKYRQAGKLLKRLQAKFSPGALLHIGQGKWYPGESLPRWAFGCYWRKDRLPIWEREVTGVIEKQWGTSWKRFAAVLLKLEKLGKSGALAGAGEVCAEARREFKDIQSFLAGHPALAVTPPPK